VRHGFFPRGGGRIEVDITSAPLDPIECLDRGAPMGETATVLYFGLSFEIAKRMLNRARKALSDWLDRSFAVRELPADQGPGIVVLLAAGFEHAPEVVSGFGKMGVTAERIAATACARMTGYIDSGAFAGPYLADQLLLPFALAGAAVSPQSN